MAEREKKFNTVFPLLLNKSERFVGYPNPNDLVQQACNINIQFLQFLHKKTTGALLMLACIKH